MPAKQMDNLAKSVYARYRQLFEPDYPLPEDAYTGEYVALIAELIKAEQAISFLLQKMI